MLQRFAPPASGGTSFLADFTRVFAHFTQERVWPRWKSLCDLLPEIESRDAADQLLVRYASDKKLPIVTHEGYTMEGIVRDNTKNNMRGRCEKTGVAVFAPREFYAGKIDESEESEEIQRFLATFKEEGLRWLGERQRRHGRDGMWDVMNMVLSYYRLILLGETEGETSPIPVTMPWATAIA